MPATLRMAPSGPTIEVATPSDLGGGLQAIQWGGQGANNTSGDAWMWPWFQNAAPASSPINAQVNQTAQITTLRVTNSFGGSGTGSNTYRIWHDGGGPFTQIPGLEVNVSLNGGADETVVIAPFQLAAGDKLACEVLLVGSITAPAQGVIVAVF